MRSKEKESKEVFSNYSIINSASLPPTDFYVYKFLQE